MHINSEGIVFRQVKTTGGRKMVHLFTKKYGKISAGSNISEKSRTKSALAMQLFTYGNYEIYKSKEFYILNSGVVKKTFFRIAEDVVKYMWVGTFHSICGGMKTEISIVNHIAGGIFYLR